MIGRIRRQPIESVLALLAAVLLVLAAQALIEERRFASDANDEKRRLEDVRDEAASYDLAALTEERDGLASGGESAFPTREEAELRIGEVGQLIVDAGLQLGPVKQAEISAVVDNSDIGLNGELPGPRTYPAIEWTLEVTGDIGGLIALSDQLLRDVPGATFHDLLISQDPVLRTSSLLVRIVFYHQPV